MTLELNRIHTMRCHDMFAQLPEQAALIVADPPYGIKQRITSMGKKPAMIAGVYQERDQPRRHEMDAFDDRKIDTSWIPLAYNALQDGGAMYLFTRWDVLYQWHAAVLETGFKVVQRIVWDKALWGAGDLRYYGSQTEDILVCVKGAHRMRWDKREGNVWKIGRGVTVGQDGGGRHPTQKPVRLMSRIITYSSDVNDLIVDPFTGSGAACIAAQRLHRRFIGTDISPTFAAAAQAWIRKDAPHTLPLFTETYHD
jgi:DNA modification methylase